MSSQASAEDTELRLYTPAEAIEKARTREPFLVDSLICPTVTLVCGPPEVGKSTVLVSLVAAALRHAMTGKARGGDFLGKAFNQSVRRVVILTTEVDGVDEYTRRLRAFTDINAAETPWCIGELNSLTEDGWLRVVEQLAPAPGDVFILDNLSQVIRGSVNDDAAVRVVFDGLRRFTSRGAAVVVVAHVSEKPGTTGSYSTKPLGSTLISAGARWRVRVSKKPGDQLKLTCGGNAVPGAEFVLERGDHTADLRVVDSVSSEELTERTRRRSDAKADLHRQAAGWLVEHHPTATKAEAGRRLAAQFPRLSRARRPDREIAKHLSNGQNVGGFLRRESDRWVMADG